MQSARVGADVVTQVVLGMMACLVAGVRTAIYSWKKRHAEIEHGITIREI